MVEISETESEKRLIQTLERILAYCLRSVCNEFKVLDIFLPLGLHFITSDFWSALTGLDIHNWQHSINQLDST